MSGKLFVIFGILLGGIYVLLTVLLSHENTLGEFAKFLLVAAGIVAFVRPKLGFVIWLFACGYIDLFKRLLVVSGRVAQMDLYYVLGIPPVIIAAIAVKLVLTGAPNGRRLRREDWRNLMIAISLMVLAAGLAARSAKFSLSGLLPELANSALYASLVFIVPLLFQTLEDITRALKLMMVIFVPVALYGVVQQVFGYQNFEIEYLLTGLSIEVKQLVMNEVRAFSTLNSPTALSFCCAALAVVAVVVSSFEKQAGVRRPLGSGWAVLLFIVFLAGLAASTQRTALVLLPFPLLGWKLFQRADLTRITYAGLLVVIGLTALSADWLLNTAIPMMTETVISLAGDNQFANQMLRVGTYTDRLLGFRNVWMNPNAYSWFGLGEDRIGAQLSDEFYNHDPLSSLLIRHGVVVVLPVLVFGVWAVFKMHQSLLRIEAGARRSLAAGLTGIVVMVVLASVLQGNVLVNFPTNGFSWLFAGMVMAVHSIDRERFKHG